MHYYHTSKLKKHELADSRREAALESFRPIFYKFMAISSIPCAVYLWRLAVCKISYENNVMSWFFTLKKFGSILSDSQLVLALVVWLVVENVAGAQQFPYQAYVTGEQAYVRSGPGQRYYPTSEAPEGFAVEVYRHDRLGWCAIRPPAGSFSWIPSHQVRVLETGVVEIVEDRVVARIGTSLSPNRSAVQVLLPKGERLELLAPAENDDPRWVRIAAPAGEFRWIAAKNLSRQPPLEAAPLPKTSESAWSRQSELTRSANSDQPNAFDHLNPITQETSREIPSKVLVVPSDPNAMNVVAGSPAELQLMQFQSQEASVPPPALLDKGNASAPATPPLAKSSQPRVRFRGLTTALPITVSSVEELELQLSQSVIQPPQQWEMAPLESAANRLLEGTKAPAERAQLREVLARIKRFKQVQQGYNNQGATDFAGRDPFETPDTTDDAKDEKGLTGLSSSIRKRVEQDLTGNSSPTSPSPEKPRYDATGFLKPVVSKREHAPQYALVDELGKVLSFVTPTPDLNLKPYVGRRIGVHGTRGFMPEYRRAHVTAGRVTPIEGTVRR